MDDIYSQVVHLARLALAGRQQDIQLFLRRLTKSLRESQPEAGKQIEKLLAASPTRGNPLREVETAVPVDADSRLQLVRTEHPVVMDSQPILLQEIADGLNQVVSEREQEQELLKEGLHPTKSILFTGPPGVGKSMAARWLAQKLNRPLVTLDLSSVMSSYLGRTGVNLRYVFDYAKDLDCVLLLDELDAVAKMRNDDAEIGELKRLVTVLLQEIDGWPPSGLLVAATNHPELLDPAAWRRFERVFTFPMPELHQVRETVARFLAPKRVRSELINIAAASMSDMSYSDIERELRRIRRESVVSGEALETTLNRLTAARLPSQSREIRERAAALLMEDGVSIRQANKLTGLHRNTLTKLKNKGLTIAEEDDDGRAELSAG